MDDRLTEPHDTAICTWFVSDAEADATFFPQIGANSNKRETQDIYWRCVACFFASSVVANPGRRHVFFSNAAPPVVDGVSFAELFRQWRVEVVTLPITYRLSKGEVKSWGNQFYIFDIIDWMAAATQTARWIVLDADCVWIRPADEIERAIDEHGVLTYELGDDEHAADEAINGLSRDGMARFLAALSTGAFHTMAASCSPHVMRMCRVWLGRCPRSGARRAMAHRTLRGRRRTCSASCTRPGVTPRAPRTRSSGGSGRPCGTTRRARATAI